MPDIAVPGPAGPEPVLVVIGDVGFTATRILTPQGSVPVAGSTLFFSDLSRTETRTPSWAIVLAIIGFFFFLLGLLFLLVKETATTGSLQLTVQNGAFVHTSQLPASDCFVVADTHQRVAYARALLAAAGPRGA